MTISENIKQLLKIVADLKRSFPNKEFTLDGRLVGDIGEVLVQDSYDVHLYSKIEKKYDGFDSDNRKVQIKATFKDFLNFPCDEKDVPDYYIGIKINVDGSFEEIFNGKGSAIWQIVKNRKKTKISTFKISLSALKKLNEKVDIFDKIEEKNNKRDVDSIGTSMYTVRERINNKYLKKIKESMITDSILKKYSSQLKFCNLNNESLVGQYYDRNGWIYYEAGNFYSFDLRITEFIKNNIR